jgi:hypothetical protein
MKIISGRSREELQAKIIPAMNGRSNLIKGIRGIKLVIAGETNFYLAITR